MIMKLHTLTPHESRMCPIDFGVKRSTVKVMAHGYLKMVHRNNGCRFEFVGVGGGPVLLQQYFQYAFICCPYMLPLLFFMPYTDDFTWNYSTITSNSTLVHGGGFTGMGYTFKSSKYMNGYTFRFKCISMGYLFFTQKSI